MNSIVYLLLLLIINDKWTIFVYSTPVYYDDCGNGEIKSIDIEPCHSLPCHFEKGERANVTIIFQPKQKSNYLRVHSTLRTGGLFDYQIKVTDEDPEVCQSSNSNRKNWGKIKCPVLPGNTYTFKVSRIFPASTTWNMFRYSKIQLLNEYGEIVVCCDWHLEFNRASNDYKMLYVQNANNSSLSF
ncbi:mite group 2 allergen-like Ixo r 2 [Dermatophagoides pteronyssinus]|uniref:mite group 2 allergen-like Ixo r 2 n=1 Tax=Dermatophagoides pteronyssinus TaxID=6956 RepID=UPI003F664DAA